MKASTSRYLDKWSEYIAEDLRGEYYSLKSMHDRNPDLYSKKDVKALKRVANYYSLPEDQIK